MDSASPVDPGEQSLRKKKRYRVLTNERRRQNRDAQRRFREKRRGVCNSSIDRATQCEQVAVDGAPIAEFDLSDPSLSLYLGQSEDQDTRLDGFFDLGSVQPSTFTDSITSMGSSRSQASFLRHPTGRAAILPSPQMNYLQVQKLNFYAARIQNALYMGLPLFLASKEEEISPWYWHTQFTMLLCTSEEVDESFSSCVPRPIRRRPCFNMSRDIIGDLAPTPLQCSHPHSMYLDMIPFPVFRDRAITLLAMSPPAFDESELKRDIEDDGLMVWGVGNGSVDRTATLVRDKRNWECSKKFAKKWRLLVQGSGLDEQSQWWRRMRGED